MNDPKAQAAQIRRQVHEQVAAATTPDGGSYEVGKTGERRLVSAGTKPYVHDAAKAAAAREIADREIEAAHAEAAARSAPASTPAPAPAAAETGGASISTDANTSNAGKKR